MSFTNFSRPTGWFASGYAGLAIGAAIVTLCAVSAHAETTFPRPWHRGIAIAHTMAWAPVEPAPSSTFVFPPFEHPAKSLSAEADTLRRTGFDFVRLAVDPGPFLQFVGARRNELDRMLLARVNEILSAGLSVIVDFHPSDIHSSYRPEVLTRGAGTQVFQAYLALLGRTAQILNSLPPGRVALELMNEPPVAPEAWRPMLEAGYRAARTAASRLVLVLDGGDAPIPQNTKLLAQYKDDPAVLFSFHYYDPYQFTHQGAPWMAARYLADVPYPALARPMRDSVDASAALIAATKLSVAEKQFATLDTQERLEAYRRSSFDRGNIASTFDLMALWAQRHAIPLQRIILGEFGAIKNTYGAPATRKAERARWLRDVRKEAEARGFVWAAWVYRGGGFSLSNDDESNELDPGIVDALGLRR
jgi:endoglucanase